jgi:hypothetical protein
VIHLGLHTCVHAWHSPENQNTTMIAQHKRDLKTLMKAVRTAVDRTPPHTPRTQVVDRILCAMDVVHTSWVTLLHTS